MTHLILRTLAEAVSPVVGRYYYLTRPSVLNEDVRHFAVIDLPLRFRRRLIGHGRSQTQTGGVIKVYSKAKADNTPNIGDITSLPEKVEGLFPISGDGFSCTDPGIRYLGADDYGYQVAWVSFDIFIKRNK